MKDDVYKSGVEKADKLFQGNFSAYICFLICKDREEKAQVRRMVDDKVASAVDNILNI